MKRFANLVLLAVAINATCVLNVRAHNSDEKDKVAISRLVQKFDGRESSVIKKLNSNGSTTVAFEQKKTRKPISCTENELRVFYCDFF